MSFDVVVWLGCAVTLPQALPTPQAWVHYHLPALKIEGLQPAIAAKLGDSETWQLVSEEHLINASYASKDPLTIDDLKSVAPGIKVFANPSSASVAASAADSVDQARQSALQNRLALLRSVSLWCLKESPTKASTNCCRWRAILRALAMAQFWNHQWAFTYSMQRVMRSTRFELGCASISP